MLSCRELTERASLIVDGALPAGERFGVRLHLLICPYCRRFLRQLRGVVGAVAGRGAQKNAMPLDSAFTDQLVARMTQATPPHRNDSPPG